MHTAIQIMTILKQRLNDPAFQATHRDKATAFTRKRHLSFSRASWSFFKKACHQYNSCTMTSLSASSRP